MRRPVSSVISFITIFSVSVSAFFITPVSRKQIKLFDVGSRLRQSTRLKSDSDSSDPENIELKEKEGGPVKNKSLLRLAELSLEDYEWRQSIFKTNEADRKVEESLARMMGEEAAYLRPMDAGTEKIGPLVSTKYAKACFSFSL